MPASYPKRRRRAKALLSVGLVLLTLFILSSRLSLGVLFGPHRTAFISAGSLFWHWSITDLSADLGNHTHLGPFFLDRNDEPFDFWFTAGHNTEVNGYYGFPLILPILATLLPGIVLTYRTRHRPGHCPRCDYDLAGLETAKCPECGRQISSPK